MKATDEVRQFFDDCMNGEIGKVKEALAKNPKLAHATLTTENRETALHFAVLRPVNTDNAQCMEKAKKEIVLLLLRNGANINALAGIGAGGDFTTPLQESIQYSYNDIAKTLIDQGADINKCATSKGKPEYSRTPLLDAIKKGTASIVKHLVNHHVYIHQKFNDSPSIIHTPLSLSQTERYKDSEIGKILKQAGDSHYYYFRSMLCKLKFYLLEHKTATLAVTALAVSAIAVLAYSKCTAFTNINSSVIGKMMRSASETSMQI